VSDKRKISFDEITWSEPAPGVKFKAAQRPGRQLRLVAFSEAFEEPDWCTRAHAGYVISGHMSIEFTSGIEEFSQGDGLFIAAGDRHRHHTSYAPTLLFLVEDV